MIASMYRRRMKAALIFAPVIFLLGAAVFMIEPPDLPRDWITYVPYAISGLFMLSLAHSSRRKWQRVKNISLRRSAVALPDLNHLVLKKDLGLFPCLLLFEKDGAFVGILKPLRVPLLLYPVCLLLSFMSYSSLIPMLPVTYGLFSAEGRVLLTFRRAGIKQSRVSIRDERGEQIGTYVQEDFKSVIRMRGTLIAEDGTTLLPVEIKGFSGDFTLTDAAGRHWAHFYNGYFPHEFTHLFQDMNNDIVELSAGLPEPHKKLLIAMLGFIFLERSK